MTSTTTAATFQLGAYCHRAYDYTTATYGELDLDQPYHAKVEAVVATLEDAQAIVAQFPKSAGLRAATLYGDPEGRTGFVSLTVKLAANGVTGERNETGVKRLRSFLKKAEALGLAVEYRANAANSYPDQETFAQFCL